MNPFHFPNAQRRHTTSPKNSCVHAFGLAMLASTIACGPQGDTDSDPGVDGPWQSIEAGIDPETVESLLAATDLRDAREVADFHIYRPEPEGLDLQSPNCGLIQTGAIDSECGGCFCMPELAFCG